MDVGEGAFNLGAVGHVRLEEPGPFAQRHGERMAGVAIHVENSRRSAGGHNHPRRSGAQSGRAAADDDGLACQLHGIDPSSEISVQRSGFTAGRSVKTTGRPLRDRPGATVNCEP
jgi:hypothetical protein